MLVGRRRLAGRGAGGGAGDPGRDGGPRRHAARSAARRLSPRQPPRAARGARRSPPARARSCPRRAARPHAPDRHETARPFEPEAGAYDARLARHGMSHAGRRRMRTTTITTRSRARPRSAHERHAGASKPDRRSHPWHCAQRGAARVPPTTAPPRPPTALLQLMRLASPSLPVGGFSYSEGIESAVDGGLASRDEASPPTWLVDQLRLGLARATCRSLAQALAAWRRDDVARIAALNDLVRDDARDARAAPADRADGPLAGRMAAQPRRRRRAPRSPRGAGAGADLAGRVRPRRRRPARRATALLPFAFGWAENMVQAALKAVPLGQSAGQRVLAALAAEIPIAVDAALALATTSCRRSRRCSPSCRRSTRRSTRGCSGRER